VLGVPVGEITAIEPYGDRVKVTLEVSDEHPLPADVGAVVVARSVATDRYVELTPVYEDGPTLESGDEIPIRRTRTPVDFDEVLESLNDFATGIGGSRPATRAIERFIDQGAAALRGRGALLNGSIHSLSEGVNGLHSQRENLAGALGSLDVLLSAVAANEDTARTFVQQVARASDLLAGERRSFRRALDSLDRAVTTVAEFAVTNRDQFVDVLDGSTRVMRTLLSKQDRLREILQVFPVTLENVQLATNGDRLPVIFDPVALDPLGGVLRDVCDRLPPAVCELLSLDPLGNLGGGG
jgi:phospholipid/cholesterol/gamma-HCH transport system substrate-binding protein